MGKIVITKQNNRLLLALFNDKKPYLLETSPLFEETGILWNIYLAKVKDIVPAMHSAFLSISNDRGVYMSLDRCRELLIANRELAEGETIRQGDEIVVQIVGEAMRRKKPTASETLTLAGQYCVCNFFGHSLHYSKKLSEEKKLLLHEAIKAEDMEGRKRYHFTIRTNAGNLTDYAPLFEEMRSFIEIFDTITATYKHRTCYTCFYHREIEIITQIKNISLTAYDEIVTDEAEVFELLTDTFKDRNIRLYQDDMISLSKLYSMETHLKEALGKKVWLPCGGYLVIEPTEALVAIDVNSGKADSKGEQSREYCMKVNLEAAKEVARQLRIRNYSGMIMVDFINMEKKADKRLLLRRLDEYLREDKVNTRLVDLTALGIVEITRKKASKPLADFFRDITFE